MKEKSRKHLLANLDHFIKSEHEEIHATVVKELTDCIKQYENLYSTLSIAVEIELLVEDIKSNLQSTQVKNLSQRANLDAPHEKQVKFHNEFEAIARIREALISNHISNCERIKSFILLYLGKEGETIKNDDRGLGVHFLCKLELLLNIIPSFAALFEDDKNNYRLFKNTTTETQLLENGCTEALLLAEICFNASII